MNESTAMVAGSECMLGLLASATRVALAHFPVVVSGETGTGKDLLARWMHGNGPRRQGPFVVVDCGTIPEHLAESQYFGHVAGAFTDARVSRRGLFEQAHGGTLVLDEVTEIPLPVQAKLLRTLETGAVRRIGAPETTNVCVRVIATCREDLSRAVARGRFRMELYYRLAVAEIRIPPLRERIEDIPALVEKFLSGDAGDGCSLQRLSRLALEALLHYSWPGNVRELRSELQRLKAICDRPVATPGQLSPHILPPHGVPVRKLRDAMDAFEVLHVRRTLLACRNNRSRAARLLGISRKSLYNKLKNLERPLQEPGALI